MDSLCRGTRNLFFDHVRDHEFGNKHDNNNAIRSFILISALSLYGVFFFLKKICFLYNLSCAQLLVNLGS